MSAASSQKGAAEIRSAATILLVRDGVAGLETLLVRRSSSLVFHGGAWVFPGGRVDAAGHLRLPAPADPTDPAHEEAARRAAIREAREEVDLVCDELSMIPFSHWTTPPGRPRRFSTWFFIAPAPEGAVTVDSGEITEHQWCRPADALAQQSAGEIELPPPTYVSLCRLGQSHTVQEALAEASSVPTLRFEPSERQVEGGVVWLYPGDVAYQGAEPLDEPGPRHRLWGLSSGWRYERGDR